MKQHRSEGKKYVAFYKLTLLSKKLLNFTASRQDKEQWDIHLATLSYLPLKVYEEYQVEEFKDFFEKYLLIYHHDHPPLIEKYGENIIKASTAAKKELLTIVLWEAYRAININESWQKMTEEVLEKYGEHILSASIPSNDLLSMTNWEAFSLNSSSFYSYNSWKTKIEEVIHVNESNEYKVRSNNNDIELEDLLLLTEQARNILKVIANTSTFDTDYLEWHDTCSKVLLRLNNLWSINKQLEKYLEY